MDELGVKNKMSLFCDSLLMQNQWVCTARVAKLHLQHGSYTAKQHGIGTASATQSVHSGATRSIHSTVQQNREPETQHSKAVLQETTAAYSTAAVATDYTQHNPLYSCVATVHSSTHSTVSCVALKDAVA